jgi:hypothetical protein
MPGQAAIAQQRDKLPHLATGKKFPQLDIIKNVITGNKNSLWQGYRYLFSFKWLRENPIYC